MTQFSELEVGGEVITPDDPDWFGAHAAWNLAAEVNPVAVVRSLDAEDVASTIRFAVANGLRVSAQGTGHGARALEPLDGTILIKTERMRGIEIDSEQRSARVEAGVLSLEIAEAAEAHQLSWLPGSSPDISVTGYALGGGMGWLGRQHGFACNHVKAFEVVTAEGEQKTVDADNDSDLFWALRGGGGAFAVVTAMHLELLPVAEVYGGALLFPAALGAEAIRAYRDWTLTAPEQITSIIRFLTPPDVPDVPEPLRGMPLLTIDAAFVGGSEEEGREVVAGLRAIGEPIMDMLGQMPASQMCRIHMDPEHPVPGLSHHAGIASLSDEAIDAFVGAVGADSGSPLLLAELRHLGGALSRAADGGGALAKLEAEFMLFACGIPMPPQVAPAIEASLGRLVEAMAPWETEHGYYNFSERPCGVDAILPADVCARLGEVKDRWDPAGTIVAAHPVAATSG